MTDVHAEYRKSVGNSLREARFEIKRLREAAVAERERVTAIVRNAAHGVYEDGPQGTVEGQMRDEILGRIDVCSAVF